MSVYERVGRNQKVALSALHHGHETVLELMKPIVTMYEPLLKMTAELPRVEGLPTPVQTVDQWFGFFDDLLKEEKQFFLEVIDLLPTRVVAAPAVKATPKAA
jgi:hypothetical protein